MNSVFCYMPENQHFNLKCSIGEFIMPSPLVRLSAQTRSSDIDFSIKMIIWGTACAEIVQKSHKRCVKSLILKEFRDTLCEFRARVAQAV